MQQATRLRYLGLIQNAKQNRAVVSTVRGFSTSSTLNRNPRMFNIAASQTFGRSLRANAFPIQFVRAFSTEPKVEEKQEAQVIEGEAVDVPKAQPEKEIKTMTPQDTATIVGNAKKHEFQAETRKILDIVVRSLYTDKEVFIRELISNASDALEKFRHATLSGQEVEDPQSPLEINIYNDTRNGAIIIQDNGIGMTEQELITNLGRIGHSGSADFLKNIGNVKDKSAIIGQFGVGFYSAFMVASKVTVYSKSALPGSKGYCWSSDGSGSYEIAEAEGIPKGTKIIISLNSECKAYSEYDEVEAIIKKYSNFVGFPIKLNTKPVNTVKALWMLNKDQVSQEEHNEFFKYISHSYADPLANLHYATDSPISIRALFYLGPQNPEKFGMGRVEPGVNLFSRKVLIKNKAKELLPDWLRFVKGVVDSEDVPLNISREFLQDSHLIRRIKGTLVKRLLKWFDELSKTEPEIYKKFYIEYEHYLKEGICSEYSLREDIGKLLRFESSATEPGNFTSLDEYISRMPENQKEIYYLTAPSRSLAETSPYYESFKSNNCEVLFLFSPFDDFVMNSNLMEYKAKKLSSAEGANLAVKQDASADALTADEVANLIKWMKEALEGKVSSIKPTERLAESPAIITGHESTAYRRMMKFVDPQRSPVLPKQQLEINPKHALIKKLYKASLTKPKLASIIAQQILDNALVSAGLVDDARVMVTRMNQILTSALEAPDDIASDETK